MASPPKNTCTPSNIYGPIEQTLFLGCSVMNFSASVGWNEQSSTITVHLVEDTCSGHSRVYFDDGLDRRTTTNADPGFYGLDRWQTSGGDFYSGDRISSSDTLIRSSSLIIGVPVYFRLGDFEYSGLVQSFERVKGESGNPTYTVQIISPTEILKNLHLIINDYSGLVGHPNIGFPYNVINVFGYMEQFGVPCPLLSQTQQGVYGPGDIGIDGSIFGSHAGGFGGANSNDNGMQWNTIRQGLNILLNATPLLDTSGFANHGRLIFKGPKTANYGIMPHDIFDPGVQISFPGHSGHLCEYYVDISELPAAPSYWRFDGTEISLLEAITRITDDAGYDYFVELIPIKNAGFLSASGIAKFIKIRVVSRKAQPGFGQIQSFIGDSAGTIDTKLGRELRNEPTTKFVIGGRKQSVYQINQSTDPEGDGNPADIEADDIMLPYFGLNSFGNTIIPTTIVEVYLSQPITEDELNSAIGGYDAWLIWSMAVGTDITQSFASGNPEGGPLRQKIRFDLVAQALDNGVKGLLAQDVAGANLVVKDQDNPVDIDLDIVYNWVVTFAKQFLGRQFQIRIPYTCAQFDSESNTYTTSESPTEGGWTEVNNVIGLANPGVAVDFFQLDNDNRIGNILKWTDVQNTGTLSKSFSHFPSDEYIEVLAADNTWDLYVKAETEPEFVYLNAATFFVPRIVVKISQSIMEPDNDPIGKRGLVHVRKFIGENAIIDNVKNRVGGYETNFEITPKMILPESAALALQSNINSYGPWVTSGPAGGVIIENDDGLVPWNYGSFSTLNLAGQSKADEGVTFMQVGENGQITVPGYPTNPLGAELGAVAGGFFRGGSNLIENRKFSLGKINKTHHTSGATSFQFARFAYSGRQRSRNNAVMEGIFGPNITGIEISTDAQGGSTTTYTLSTYTKKFGRMSKTNADRIKILSQQQMTNDRAQRQISLKLAKLGAISRSLQKSGSGGDNRKQRDAARGKKEPQSPHQILVGEMIEWGSLDTDKRTAVASESIYDYPMEIADSGYAGKAFMSLDGMFRPISMDGGGTGLPQYYASFDGGLKYSAKNMQSPVFVDSTSVSLTGVGITGDDVLTAYDKDVDIDYLNPFTNPRAAGARNKLMQDYESSGFAAHDINVLGRGADPPPSSVVMPIEGQVNPASIEDWDYRDDYRMMALRGPLIIQGWGYDIHGKPIPNAADIESDIELGNVFENSGLHNQFLPNFMRNPQTWPVGEVDLRFDRARGVWVSPPSYRLVYGSVTEPAGLDPGGSGLAVLDTLGEQLYDTGGNVISPDDTKIILYDKVDERTDAGEKFIGYYDVFDDKHYLIHKASSGETIFCTHSGCPEVGDIIEACYAPTGDFGVRAAVVFSLDGIVFVSGSIGPTGVGETGADGMGIGLDIIVGGAGPIDLINSGIVNTIEAGFGLIWATGAGDCAAELCTTGLTFTTPCFVTGVECVGGDITGNGLTLEFTRGILVGTGVC